MTSTQVDAELKELHAHADQLLAVARQQNATSSATSAAEQPAALAQTAPSQGKKPSRPPEPPGFLEKPLGRALAFLFTLVCALLLVALFQDWIRLPGEPGPQNAPQRVAGLLGTEPAALQPLALFRTKHNFAGAVLFRTKQLPVDERGLYPCRPSPLSARGGPRNA